MPIVSTSSDSFRKSGIFGTFGTQDCKWLDILEELGDVEKAIEHDVNVTNLGRFDTIFPFSHRILLDGEVKVLEK